MKYMFVIMMMVFASVVCAEEKNVVKELNAAMGDEFFVKGEFDLKSEAMKDSINEKNLKDSFNLWGKIELNGFENVKSEEIKKNKYVDSFKYADFKLFDNVILGSYSYKYNDKFNSIFFTLFNTSKGYVDLVKNETKSIYFDVVKNNVLNKMKKVFGEPEVENEPYLTYYTWHWMNYTFQMTTSNEESVGKFLITFDIYDNSNEVKIPSNWKEVLKNNVDCKREFGETKIQKVFFKEYPYPYQNNSDCMGFSRSRAYIYYGVNVNIHAMGYLIYDVFYSNKINKSCDPDFNMWIFQKNKNMQKLEKMYGVKFEEVDITINHMSKRYKDEIAWKEIDKNKVLSTLKKGYAVLYEVKIKLNSIKGGGIDTGFHIDNCFGVNLEKGTVYDIRNRTWNRKFDYKKDKVNGEIPVDGIFGGAVIQPTDEQTSSN